MKCDQSFSMMCINTLERKSSARALAQSHFQGEEGTDYLGLGGKRARALSQGMKTISCVRVSPSFTRTLKDRGLCSMGITGHTVVIMCIHDQLLAHAHALFSPWKTGWNTIVHLCLKHIRLRPAHNKGGRITLYQTTNHLQLGPTRCSLRLLPTCHGKLWNARSQATIPLQLPLERCHTVHSHPRRL